MSAPFAFPRGGSLTSRPAISIKGREDALFGSKRTRVIEEAPNKKRKLNKKKDEGHSLSTIAGVGLGMVKPSASNSIARIEPLSFVKYTQGTLSLAMPLSITDTGITVSLPGGLSGHINANEVSDYFFKHFAEKKYKPKIEDLKSMISILAPLRCYVLGVNENKNGRKTIALSMRSSLIHRGLALKHLVPGFPLSGCVSSIEDHGIVVSSGVSGVTCFLPTANIPASMDLKLGQPIECVVDEINEVARTVSLRAHKKSVQETVTRNNSLSFVSLHPGMLVNASVQKILTNGLIVRFFDDFNGVIDMFSLSRPLTSTEMKANFSEGDIVLARIVFVDHSTKTCRLSMKPHILEFRMPKYLPELGEKVTDITVVNIQKKTGVLASKVAEINDEEAIESNAKSSGKKKAQEAIRLQRQKDEKCVGIYIHRSSLFQSDDKKSDIDDLFKVASVIPIARVIGYHLVEGVALASTKETVVEGKIIHPSQLKVGQIHEADVTEIMDFGLKLKIGGRINVICPLLHLSDTGFQSAKLNKLFKVGQSLTVRIWEVNRNAIVVTHKKSLVQQEHIVDSYDHALESQKVVGVISDINHDGIRVHFFNRVRGYIPMSILVKQGVLDVQESYRVGQLLECVIAKRFSQVIGENKSGKKTRIRLVLALDLGELSEEIKKLALATKKQLLNSDDNDDEGDNIDMIDMEKNNVADANVHSLTAGVLIKYDGDILHIRLDDGRLGHLHKQHCFDFVDTCNAFFEDINHAYPIGHRFEKLLVLSSGKKFVIVTAKPLLLAGFDKDPSNEEGCFPSTIATLAAGNVVVGVVHKVESFGVLVKFLDNLVALAPRPNLADKFVSSPEGLYKVGDSIRCVIQLVDLSADRIILSFKPSVVPPSTQESTYLVAKYRENMVLSQLSAKKSDKIFPDLKAFALGSTTEAIISSIETYGIILVASDHSTIMLAQAPNHIHCSKKLTVGARMTVRILDFDFENHVLLVSLNENLLLVDSVSKSNEKTGKGKKKSKNDSSASSSMSSSTLSPFQSVGSILDCEVQLVHNHHLVVSSGKFLAYGMVADFHCPLLSTEDFVWGQTIKVKVESVVHDLLGENLLNGCVVVSLVTSHAKVREKTAKLLKEEKKNADGNHVSKEHYCDKFAESMRIGSILPWKIATISATELKVAPLHNDVMQLALSASVHVSNAIDNVSVMDSMLDDLTRFATLSEDRSGIHSQHPFFGLSEQDVVFCRVLKVMKEAGQVYPSTVHLGFVHPQGKMPKEKDLSEEQDLPNVMTRPLVQWEGSGKIQSGNVYAAAITHIHPLFVSVALSPFISGKFNMIDVSSDPAIVTRFRDHCFVGQRILVGVKNISSSSNSSSSSQGNQKSTSHGVILSRHGLQDLLANSTEKELSKLRNISFCEEKTSEWQVGKTVWGMLDLKSSSVPRPPAVLVALRNGKYGRICATELTDPSCWKDLSEFSSLQSHHSKKDDSSVLRLPYGQQHGDLVQCKIISLKDKSLELSIRSSRMTGSKKSSLIMDPLPKENDTVKAYVTMTSNKGCFVRLSTGISGMIWIKDLSNEFIEQPEAAFPCGKLVEGRVLNVDAKDNKVKMTLKSSTNQAKSNEKGMKDLEKLVVGSIVSGTVQRVNDYGVFVAIDGTTLVGLSRRPQAVSAKVESLEDAFSEGDIVRAKVLAVSKESMKISLGLRSCYFKEEDEEDARCLISEPQEEEEEEEQEEEEDDDDENDVENVLDAPDEEMEDMDEEIEDEDEETEQEEEEEEENHSIKKGEKRSLDSSENNKLSTKKAKTSSTSNATTMSTKPSISLLWDDFNPMLNPFHNENNKTTMKSARKNDDEDDDEDDDENENDDEEDNEEEDDENHGNGGSKSHRQRQKEQQKRKEEDEIRRREEALESGDFVPETASDFERLLVAQPNSSYLWIQFMTFFLQTADLQGARNVAERALKAINFRQEEEKFNIWVAFLNLEKQFGSQESLENVFKRAIAESRAKYLYLHLAELYEKAGDVAGVEAVFQRCLKKFKYSKKVWMAYQHFRLRQGDEVGANEILSRSLQSLEKHKHVEVIQRFALLEYDVGNPEKGRYLLEELVSTYPKRTDLWHVYVDREIKQGDVTHARQLFERMLTCKMSVRNMKSIFKKYLDFEKKHGDLHSQEIVKQKARDYVSKMM